MEKNFESQLTKDRPAEIAKKPLLVSILSLRNFLKLVLRDLYHTTKSEKSLAIR